jgi:cysteine/glycine-rich protein
MLYLFDVEVCTCFTLKIPLDQLMSAGNIYHKLCFKCAECKKLLEPSGATPDKENNVYCKGCYAAKLGPKGYGFGSALNRTE